MYRVQLIADQGPAYREGGNDHETYEAALAEARAFSRQYHGHKLPRSRILDYSILDAWRVRGGEVRIVEVES